MLGLCLCKCRGWRGRNSHWDKMSGTEQLLPWTAWANQGLRGTGSIPASWGWEISDIVEWESDKLWRHRELLSASFACGVFHWVLKREFCVLITVVIPLTPNQWMWSARLSCSDHSLITHSHTAAQSCRELEAWTWRGILFTGSHQMLDSKIFTFILHMCIVNGKTFHSELAECKIHTRGGVLAKSLYLHFTEFFFLHSFEACRMQKADLLCLGAGPALCALLQPLHGTGIMQQQNWGNSGLFCPKPRCSILQRALNSTLLHCVKLYVNVQILLLFPATLDRAHRALAPVLPLLQFPWEIPWEKLASKSPPAQRMQGYNLDWFPRMCAAALHWTAAAA